MHPRLSRAVFVRGGHGRSGSTNEQISERFAGRRRGRARDSWEDCQHSYVMTRRGYTGLMGDAVPIRKADPNFTDVYKVGFEEGKRAVDAQLGELEAIRSRSMVFLAFTGAATSFLIGTSLGASKVSFFFFALAIPATILWLLALILCLTVLIAPTKATDLLSPWKWWPKPQSMVMQWQFRMNPLSITIRPNPTSGNSRPGSEADIFQALAVALDRMRQHNDDKMQLIRRRYWLFVITATFQLMLWTVLAWLYGTPGA